MAQGDGENLVDMSPLGNAGVTAETLGSIIHGTLALDAAIANVESEEHVADGMVNDMASWAKAVEGMVHEVLSFGSALLAAKTAKASGAAAAPPRQSQLLGLATGALGIVGQPAANRPAAIASLLSGLLA